MIYDCKKCGKTFKQKSNYTYHVGRKRPCIQEPNISRDVLELIKEEIIYIPEATIGLTENYHKLSKHKNTKENGFKCEKCDKIYKYSSALARHKKKHKNEIEINKENSNEIKKMKDKIEELEKQIKENKKEKPTKIIHTQNIQNNIQNNIINKIINIKEFGKEDIRRLSKEDKYDILYGEGLDPLLSIIERVHFNEKIPEQKNIKYTNIKSKYLDIHNGKIWQKELVTKIVNEIMDTNILNLDGLYNEYSERSIKKIKNTVLYSMNLIKNYNKYIDGEISDEEEINNKQNLVDKKDEVKLLLHNKTKEIYV